MGMVLERAGGWKSITEYVQTNGYSLQTISSLYNTKLKPSFETIFPPKAAEATPASEAAVPEAVIVEAAPNLLEKDIVVPFTGKTVPVKAVLYVVGSVGMGFVAYKVAVQAIGKDKVDAYLSKVSTPEIKPLVPCSDASPYERAHRCCA